MGSVPVKSRFSETDARLFRQGVHQRLYEKLGAHPTVTEERPGVDFAVWAPAARYVSVIGDFNGWNKDAHPLHHRPQLGIWEGFVASDWALGAKYKYYIVGQDGAAFDKPDPLGFYHEPVPQDASIIHSLDYQWKDQAWLERRRHQKALDDPLSIYEVDLLSWMTGPESAAESPYRAVAPRLADYVQKLQFTHVAFLPLMEHQRDDSWGYETTGYFAPTSRYGSPQDFMYLVEYLHQHEIGVILDLVVAWFGDAPQGLSRFDGTELYEAQGESGTASHRKRFQYARREVRSFLISSANFWLEKFHVDGLRLAGVGSMLYPAPTSTPASTPDAGIPSHASSEDLDAVALLQRMNEGLTEDYPGVMLFADDSKAWPMICWPVKASGGLGFGFQWDITWAQDCLDYMRRPPDQRKEHHRQMTRHTLEAFNENIVLPLSHDTIAESLGQLSLLEQMPADPWQKFANLRLLLGYLYAQPGKKLLFMGNEFAARESWSHTRPLDWSLVALEPHRGVQNWVRDLNHIYRSEPALNEFDRDAEGFEWVDSHDEVRSVLSFLRKGWKSGYFVLALCNFTPQPRTNYRVGLPCGGFWKEILNSDAQYYGGSGWGNMGGIASAPIPFHDRPYSINATLPPLAIVVFKHEPGESQ